MINATGDADDSQRHAAVAVASRIETRELSEGEEAECDRFVMSSPSGTFFHLSGWQRIVREILGHRCFCLVARRENRITGVFPIGWVRNRIFGDCMVSLPLAVYGGICADDQDSYFGLLQAGSELADRLGVKYLEMRNRTEPFPTSLPGQRSVCDLYPGSVARAREAAAGVAAGYALCRAEVAKGGPGVDRGSQPDEEFYEIYAQSVHRLGTPVFSRELFTRIRSEFPKQARLFGVRKGKTAIAGVLCFYFRDQVLPYYGGALAEYYKDSPNNFMYWNLMAQSCKEGFRQFDFGRSKRGTGSFHFKSAWSMKVTELPYRYHLVRAKEVPHLSPVDKKFQLPVAAWKRIAVFVDESPRADG